MAYPGYGGVSYILPRTYVDKRATFVSRKARLGESRLLEIPGRVATQFTVFYIARQTAGNLSHNAFGCVRNHANFST